MLSSRYRINYENFFSYLCSSEYKGKNNKMVTEWWAWSANSISLSKSAVWRHHMEVTKKSIKPENDTKKQYNQEKHQKRRNNVLMYKSKFNIYDSWLYDYDSRHSLVEIDISINLYLRCLLVWATGWFFSPLNWVRGGVVLLINFSENCKLILFWEGIKLSIKLD